MSHTFPRPFRTAFALALLAGAASLPAFEESLTLSPPNPAAGQPVTAHLEMWLPEPCYEIDTGEIATDGAEHAWDLTLTRVGEACIQIVVSVEVSATIDAAAPGTNTLTVNQHWVRPGGDFTDTLVFSFEAAASAEEVVAALLDGQDGPAGCDVNSDGRVDIADLVHLLNQRSG